MDTSERERKLYQEVRKRFPCYFMIQVTSQELRIDNGIHTQASALFNTHTHTHTHTTLTHPSPRSTTIGLCALSCRFNSALLGGKRR